MSVLRSIMRITTPLHAWAYRALGGRYVDRLSGSRMPVLLLATRGRRSGDWRTVVVGYAPEGDDWVVIGSNGGLPQAPGWVHNLRAHPEAEVTIGGDRWRARAEAAEGAERERLWNRVVRDYPVFTGYQRKSASPIPVLRLRRLERLS
jgi:deazaflavin-dependent oxidoreductase (nitroreductase family)